jgi:hypothetical protein
MDELLAMGKEMGVDEDLARLSHAFYDALGSLIQSSAVLNPVFAGSCDVGGADADLIVDGCLLEIKTSVGKERLTRERLYQLMGYVLLDYNDEHSIRHVGIYFARQAALVRWSLEQFLMLLGGNSTPALDVLREEFRSVVCSTP